MKNQKKQTIWEAIRGRKHNYLDLLEAVAESGSIRAAASHCQMSYKAAWDAIQSLSELVKHPLVIRQSGGQRGGGALLSEQGKRFLAICRRLEQEQAWLANELQTVVESFDSYYPFQYRYQLKSSARNQLFGEVSSIQTSALKANVGIKLAGNLQLQAEITAASAAYLALENGTPLFALIKAPWVGLSDSQQSVNSLPCRVESVTTGVQCNEVLLEMANGEPLVADVAPEVQYPQGAHCFAHIPPAQMILTTTEKVTQHAN